MFELFVIEFKETENFYLESQRSSYLELLILAQLKLSEWQNKQRNEQNNEQKSIFQI